MIKKKLFYKIVPLISNGHRLDKFLQSQLSDLSRTKLQDLIRDGNVSINNKIIKESSKKIKEKDEVKVNFPPPKEILY